MKIIEWQDEYCVGDPLMDAHHRQFLNIVSSLSQAILQKNPSITKRAVMDFLIEYLSMHLRAEERLMAKIGFPGLDEHKAIHQAFENRILKLEHDFREDSTSLKIEDLFELSQEWLVAHILKEDKKFAPYI